MTRRIRMTNGRYTFVSDHRYDELRKISWSYQTDKGYAVCYRIDEIGNDHPIPMHRIIMGLSRKDGREVDHKDRNKLNNTDENLRVCTRVENCRNKSMRSNNTSGYIGISWNSSRKKWEAKIKYEGRGYHKRFKVKMEAIRWRDEMATKLFGDFAVLNLTKDKRIL